MKWTTKKPKLTKECLLITASKFREEWEYHLFEIKKINYEFDKYYFGILDEHGDEWGDYSDLKADKYCLLNK